VGLGVLLGIGIISGYALTPWGRAAHWRLQSGAFDPEKGRALLFVQSRCWHTVLNLRCTVIDPQGVARTAVCHPPGGAKVILQPGASAGVEFPKDFDAPPPVHGTYRIKWEMDAEDRTKPLTLRCAKWEL
jgi:hypothetical protein